LLEQPLPVTELLPDKAAFYTIKENGPWHALRDFAALRRGLTKFAGPGDVFAFERWDLRNVAVKPLRSKGGYAPKSASAYVDRRALVRELFGAAPEWPTPARPAASIRSVVVDPCARFRHRWLSPQIVDNILAVSQSNGWAVTLLDPCKRYAAYRDRVECCLPVPSLTEAVARLRATNLYIGPDSFFIHLAYYFGVPFFDFYPDNLYFQTPGMQQQQNFMPFQDALDWIALERALADHLGRAAQ
jgi:hypothetical protein